MQADAKPQQPPQTPHRYDGLVKVTGKAKYAAEFTEPFAKKDLLYAYMVQSTIANGTVAAMDTKAAERAAGVVAVLTPFNAPKLSVGAPQPPARRSLTVLQNNTVSYNGQPIAVVVAKSQDQAMHAARLIKTTYSEQPAKIAFMTRLGEARPPKSVGKGAGQAGDAAAGHDSLGLRGDREHVCDADPESQSYGAARDDRLVGGREAKRL